MYKSLIRFATQGTQFHKVVYVDAYMCVYVCPCVQSATTGEGGDGLWE